VLSFAQCLTLLEKASRLIRVYEPMSVSVNGRLQVPEYRRFTAFEQLAQAQRQI